MPPRKQARKGGLQSSAQGGSKRKRPVVNDTDHSSAGEESEAATVFLDDGYASRSGECSPPCRHHPTSTKYPYLDMPHAPSLVQFAADLDECVQAMFPRQPGYYQSAHILSLSWEEDHELDSKSQIEELGAIMQQFQFTADMKLTTSWFPIPSSRSEQMLEGRLVSARNEHALDSSQLLIVYYGGHGRIDERSGRSIWYAWRNSPPGTFRITPELDWTRLQYNLMNCSGNLLIILDCCFASATIDDEHSGVKELLAAGGVSDSTSALDANSFTRAIITEMKAIQARNEPSLFHITALFQRLYSHQTRHNLRVTPIYVPLSNSQRPGSIALRYPGPDGISQDAELPRLCELNEDSIKSESRVLISIRLTDPEKPGDVQDWAEWFATAPPSLEHVKIEAKFHSRSTLLLVSLPMALWNILPDNAAYSFIDVVESGNLLLLPKEVYATLAHVSETALRKQFLADRKDAMYTQVADVKQSELRTPGVTLLPQGGFTPPDMTISQLGAGSLPVTMGSSTSMHTVPRYWHTLEDPRSRLIRLIRLVLQRKRKHPQMSTNWNRLSHCAMTIVRMNREAKRFREIQRQKRVWWKVFRKVVQDLRDKLDSETVRIATIHSGPKDSLLSVTVAPWVFGSLGVDVQYDALSYCWGSDEEPTPINVFFASTGSIKKSHLREVTPIIVRKNLYDALKYFRRVSSDVVVWVDALCIDSRNAKAREALTIRIPEIFSKAEKVHFWMEDRDSETEYQQQQSSSWREPDRTQVLTSHVYPTEEESDPELRSGTDLWGVRPFRPETLHSTLWKPTRRTTTGKTRAESKPPEHMIAERKSAESMKGAIDAIQETLDSLDSQPISSTAGLALITKLSRSTLFKRRWVIQELFFAKRAILHWASRSIPWHDFEDAINSFLLSDFELRVSSDDYVNLKRLQALIDVVSNGARRSVDGSVVECLLSPEALVIKCAPFESSEYYPIDVVRALIGIASTAKCALRARLRHVDGHPEPSYLIPIPSSMSTMSMRPSQDVVLSYYQNFFVRAVLDSQSLDIMFRPWATIYPPGSTTTPSYMATTDQLPFRAGHGRVRSDPLVGEQQSTYNASGGLKPRLVMDNRALSVYGVTKDRVTWTSGGNPGAMVFGEAVRRACGGKTLSPVPDKLWRTLVAERGPDGRLPPGFFRRVCEACFGGKDYLNVELLLEQNPGSMKREFLRRVKAVVWNRAFFETRSGMFGIGPAEMMEGDMICVLFGCSVPVVLRDLGRPIGKENAKSYKVIGEAFVYEMMDGEKVLDRGQVEQRFVLV